jgi:hypothetical protein
MYKPGLQYLDNLWRDIHDNSEQADSAIFEKCLSTPIYVECIQINNPWGLTNVYVVVANVHQAIKNEINAKLNVSN